MGNLTLLQRLNVSHCCLSELPEELAACQSLQELDASHNGAPGHGLRLPPALLRMPQLRCLRLEATYCNLRELLQAAAAAAAAVAAPAGGNQAPSASLCSQLLPALEELYLAANGLDASGLPSELYFGHRLKTLGLSLNELAELPAGLLVQLPSLTSLDLSMNKLEVGWTLELTSQDGLACVLFFYRTCLGRNRNGLS